MTTDTISDILTRIRNANERKHRFVIIPINRMSYAIIRILKNKGYIKKFKIKKIKNRKYYLVYLLYLGIERKRALSKLKRISTPGVRIYKNSKTLPTILNNLGIAIVSTSKGIMTNLMAKKLGIGGEILCYIW
uniref:Small ribosomal subunit protein uS8c n=1 Tax=Astrosyne radiata TaxID=1158023 RepID=A0A2U9NTL5_9STRA|nr:ribosomal protein S8 [Astrosyne radiata]AWT40362.1 ribosomal protein S8 [Astrosyne radiata]